MRRAALLGLAVLAAAGCGSSHPAAQPPFRDGPPGLARIALADLPWPLDPALAESRDEIQLARVLYSTPLRVGPHNHLLPGLCSSWRSDGYRVWTLRCRHASAIAQELRRVGSLSVSPSQWLFQDAKVEARGDELRIALPRPWRRFPYALTAVAAAPRGVPGPFRVVSASPRRLVAERAGLRLVFTRMEPHAAALAFRRGELDEAPVALGDIRAAKLDAELAGMVRTWALLGVDLVAFQLRNGPLADLPNTRLGYWRLADRQSYALLVPEGAAPAAYGVAAPQPPHGANTAAQTARRGVGSLPPVAVPVAVEDAPDLEYAARLAVAQWRDAGLGASLHPLPRARFRTALANATPGAWFGRVIAPYPQTEALLGQVLLSRGGRDPWPDARSTPAALLRAALAAPDEGRRLERIDGLLREAAALVPLAEVADARLVSPRLANWREDALGSVDYTRVRALGASRRR